MKRTIEYDNKFHLVSRATKTHNSYYRIVCECGVVISKAPEPNFFSADNTIPTCPNCLKKFFSRYEPVEHDKRSTNLHKYHVNLLLNGLTTLISAQRSAEHSAEYKDSYPFIPISTHQIFHEFAILSKILRKEKRWSGYNNKATAFLDAGCGCGNVMLTALMFNLCSHIDGIECFDKTARKAEEWLDTKGNPNINAKVIRGDIMEFNDYSKYDIIYYYCPFSDKKLQTLFEKRLEDNMKVGAILIPHLKKDKSILNDDRFERINVLPTKIYYDQPHKPVFYIKVKNDKHKMFDAIGG